MRGKVHGHWNPTKNLHKSFENPLFFSQFQLADPCNHEVLSSCWHRLAAVGCFGDPSRLGYPSRLGSAVGAHQCLGECARIFLIIVSLVGGSSEGKRVSDRCARVDSARFQQQTTLPHTHSHVQKQSPGALIKEGAKGTSFEAAGASHHDPNNRALASFADAACIKSVEALADKILGVAFEEVGIPAAAAEALAASIINASSAAAADAVDEISGLIETFLAENPDLPKAAVDKLFADIGNVHLGLTLIPSPEEIFTFVSDTAGVNLSAEEEAALLLKLENWLMNDVVLEVDVTAELDQITQLLTTASTNCVDPGFSVCFVPIVCVCFSGASQVDVQGKGATRMDALQIGDSVLTGDGTFQKVYSFGHFAPDQPVKYLQIKAETMNKPLEISEFHMIYKRDKESKKKMVVAAKDIKVGDTLITGQGASMEVKSIGSLVRNGAYAPLTMNGDVVVDGAVASNYIVLSPSFTKHVSPDLQHWIEHAALTPYRTFCSLFGCEKESYDPVTGIPFYVMKWLSLVDFMERHNLVVPVVLNLVCIPILWVAFNFSTVVAALLGYYVWKKANKNNKVAKGCVAARKKEL